MSASERSDRIRALFDDVVGLGPEEREARLATACGDDQDLRREVESLLAKADGGYSSVRRALEGLRPGAASALEPGSPPSDGAPAALRAALAGRYTLERQIGRGGMATVYEARDLRHHRRVAVKVLKPSLSEGLGPDRFLREIEIAANLTHPHILPIHDSGDADGHLFYVMPLLEGGSLRDRLGQEGQLPVEDALAIAREVADALDHAHGQGVVHRDVKPENILLTGGHALLADFGVAQAVAHADRTFATREGTVVGTPAYMSPEQVAGDLELDGRADQYALGCVLFEMLAGRPAFPGSAVQHITTDPPELLELRPTVPDGVAEAVRKALSRAPADRYKSTAELGRALGAQISTATGGRAGAWSRRQGGRRYSPRAVLAALLLIAAAAVVSTYVAGAWGDGGAVSGVDYVRVAVLPPVNQTGDPAFDNQGPWAAAVISDALVRAEDLGVQVVSLEDMVAAQQAGTSSENGSSDLARTWPHETGADLAVVGGLYTASDSLQFRLRIVDREGTDLARVDPVSALLDNPSDVQEDLQVRVLYSLARLVAPGHDASWSLAGRHAPRAEAVEALREAVRIHNTGDWVEALPHFERAARIDPDYLVAKAWLIPAYGNVLQHVRADSVCQVLEGRLDGLAPDERLRTRVTCAVNRGDFATALAVSKDLVRYNPHYWYLVGFNAANLNRPREAVEAFARYDPDLGRRSREWALVNWRMWAEALHMLGEYEEELELVREARGRFPESPRLVEAEARALVALDRPAEAANLVEEWSSARPGGPPLGVLNNVALELDAHGRPERAQQVWTDILEWISLRPPEERRTPQVFLLWISSLFGLDRAEEARELVLPLEPAARQAAETGGPAVALHPLRYLGVASAKLGDRAEAERISELIASVDLPPFQDRNYLSIWRASIAAHLGERDEAVRLLEQARAEGWMMWNNHPHQEPFLKPLRGYPPFEEFVRPKG